MADNNYREIVSKASTGQLVVGVEPALARKFFTDTDSKALQREFGSSFYKERLFVKLVWLLEYPSLLAGIIASVFAFHWYSVIVIPVMAVTAFLYGAKSSGGRQKIGSVLLLLLISIFLAYLFRDRGPALFTWFVLLPLPFLFARLTYKLSTIFLRGLSLRNEKLFVSLRDKAIFLKEAA